MYGGVLSGSSRVTESTCERSAVWNLSAVRGIMQMRLQAMLSIRIWSRATKAVVEQSIKRYAVDQCRAGKVRFVSVGGARVKEL